MKVHQYGAYVPLEAITDSDCPQLSWVAGPAVVGDAPVQLASVDPDGLAAASDLRAGDVIGRINGKDALNLTHGEVISLLGEISSGRIELIVAQMSSTEILATRQRANAEIALRKYTQELATYTARVCHPKNRQPVSSWGNSEGSNSVIEQCQIRTAKRFSSSKLLVDKPSVLRLLPDPTAPKQSLFKKLSGRFCEMLEGSRNSTPMQPSQSAPARHAKHSAKELLPHETIAKHRITPAKKQKRIVVSVDKAGGPLGMGIDEETGGLAVNTFHVARIKPGGCAEATGKLEEGMKLCAVSGKSTEGLSLKEVMAMLRGSEKLKLELEPRVC